MNSQYLFQQGDPVYFKYKHRQYEGVYRGRCHSKSIILAADGTRWYIKKEKVRPKNAPCIRPIQPSKIEEIGIITFD